MPTEEIREGINETLIRYGSLPRLIESLELQRCELSNLALHSLTSFLPNLKEIKAIQNSIEKLSAEKVANLPKNFDETANTDRTSGRL
ncbi:hypothetical protein ILUMI_17618 [Ignelater luminosus]|uniref:Uncharacterized protein n=1 Tax=Ignelater luminosus TaxID=2038154 RepID=A0A8K0G1P7_IGNLU|nr:hypothetical protein ILUMI_17618 [Ignelater luminosus]